MRIHQFGAIAMASKVLRMPMTKARINLGSLVRGVHVYGDVVVLEKDGIPVAGLGDIDALEDYLEPADPALRRRIRASAKAHRAGRTRPVRGFLRKMKDDS